MSTGIFETWRRLPDTAAHDFKVKMRFPRRLPSGVFGVDLLVDPKEKLFSLCYQAKPSAETVTHIVADLIIPRLLAHDGHFVLHCGMVNSSRGAIGFMGPSGRGKSTMTAGLHNLGMALMGDDAVVIDCKDCTYSAERVYPSLRLFPDSIDQLFTNVVHTAPVADYTSKQHVSFVSGPSRAPLSALFSIVEPTDEVRIDKLKFSDACMALIANSFALDAADTIEAKRRFAKASDVACHVPVYELHYPRDYASLTSVHAKIFERIGLPLPDKGETRQSTAT
ncbi:hypothetical protein [Tateyamaria pelophila]|uniref:hypothetical protein n=1 Tax=Tateyamaria pelophila TaxID=328415 RepID=UPI001CBBD421|nr:hypothetical protein [Tateyamaria pelophila]